MTEFFPWARQTITMFVTADSLGWALHSTTTGCLLQAPMKPQLKSILEGGGAKSRSHNTHTHTLQDCSGPSHRHTKHHISYKSCRNSKKTEGVNLLWGHLCLSPSFFPFPYPGLHPPRRASLTLWDLWWSPALLGWPGAYFFVCILQYSKMNVSD